MDISILKSKSQEEDGPNTVNFESIDTLSINTVGFCLSTDENSPRHSSISIELNKITKQYHNHIRSSEKSLQPPMDPFSNLQLLEQALDTDR